MVPALTDSLTQPEDTTTGIDLPPSDAEGAAMSGLVAEIAANRAFLEKGDQEE